MPNYWNKKKYLKIDPRSVVESYGLKLVHCGGKDWKIEGGRYVVRLRMKKTGAMLLVEGMANPLYGSIEEAAIIAIDGVRQKRAESRHRDNVMIKLALWRDVKNRNCWICGKNLKLRSATVDHKIPLAAGGSSLINNCSLACLECNQDKADKLPHEMSS